MDDIEVGWLSCGLRS